jgi:nitrogen fixation/metabolism regulation signal transduction histidine kinase
MSVTRLKRKHRKNIARANNETRKIKNLLRTPVLKNVDLDELKSRFGQSAPATETAEKKKPEPSVKAEGLLDKVAHAASAAADKVKQVASDAAEAVTHTSAYEAVQEAAHNLVEGAKHALENKDPEANQATEANQTGNTGFDAAEAVTKPVNEDGQAGEHPKPEIAL